MTCICILNMEKWGVCRLSMFWNTIQTISIQMNRLYVCEFSFRSVSILYGKGKASFEKAYPCTLYRLQLFQNLLFVIHVSAFPTFRSSKSWFSNSSPHCWVVFVSCDLVSIDLAEWMMLTDSNLFALNRNYPSLNEMKMIDTQIWTSVSICLTIFT